MRIWIFLITACLSGCAALGPDYRKPALEAPAAYKEAPAGWRQAQPRDAMPRGTWWEVFADAELDRLMKRVDISNQTIRAAEARFRQARAVADQAR